MLLGNIFSIGKFSERGYKDGPAEEAMFDAPRGIVVNEHDGSLFVADTNNKVIRKISVDGKSALV